MSTSPLRRRLAAIMSIDVVSYSKMMGEDEEGTLQLLDTHRAYIDNSIRNHEGRIANTAGDSVLAEFASPVQAVRSAIEIQDNIASLNAKLPENRHMRFRVGVHVDDIIVQANGDLIGEGVNIAARLQAAVEPGGVGVSGEIVTQTRAKLPDVSFVPMGDAVLKNILRAVEPFRAVKETGVLGRTVVGITVRTAATQAPQATATQFSFARWGLAIALCIALAIGGVVAGYLMLGESPAVTAERAAWTQLQDSRSIAEIEAFLEKYPKGVHNASARTRLAKLREKEAERLARERERRDEAERLAQEKARADAVSEDRRRREEEVRASEAARAAEAARLDAEALRLAAERRRQEDMQRAEERRQVAAQRMERKLKGTRSLEFKPVSCAQSKLATTTGLNCSVSAIYDGYDGKGRFRRWAAGAHGGSLSTYIVVVEAVDSNSVHDSVVKDDEEAYLAEISNVTRHNVSQWSDIEASSAGFVAHFVTFDRRNCAAFTKPGPGRGQGLAWVMRGYICAYGSQLTPEQIRTVVEVQRVN